MSKGRERSKACVFREGCGTCDAAAPPHTMDILWQQMRMWKWQLPKRCRFAVKASRVVILRAMWNPFLRGSVCALVAAA